MVKPSGFEYLFFSAAGNVYLALALMGICVALWKGKVAARKIVYAASILTALMAPEVYRKPLSHNEQAKARALFTERRKPAGERIYLTKDGVESVFPVNIRLDKVTSLAVEGSMMKRLRHFVAGLVIVTMIYLLTNHLGYAAAAVMLAAAAKEVWDNHRPGHTEDIRDMAAFCAGWAPVALVAVL